MARSKSWTESQLPENQYSWSQYFFNVIIVGLIVAGLIGWFIWTSLDKPEIKQTKFVTIRSDISNSELRTIPYQANDFDALSKNFGEAVIDCGKFNDAESFETSVSGKFVDLEKQLTELDSVIVVCSAIGDVSADGKPILRTARGNEEISIEDFIRESIEPLKADNRIVIFDCGHDFSKPAAYLEDDFESGNDFNRFTEAVSAMASTLSPKDKRPIWLISTTDIGEIPLYSFNQRRTLFGLALENAMLYPAEAAKEETKFGSVSSFHAALTDYCHEHGGESAQSPVLIECGKGVVSAGEVTASELKKFSRPPVDEDEEADDEKPDVFQESKTAEQLASLEKLWLNRDEILGTVYAKNGLLSPSEFATPEWDSAIRELSEEVVQMRNSDGSIRSGTALARFSESRRKNLARTMVETYPGIIEGNTTDSAPVSKLGERDIAKTFATFHRVSYRAKHFTAVAESLSWIHESELFNNYVDVVSKLNVYLAKNKILFADSSTSLAETERYRRVRKKLIELDSDAQYGFNSLCNFFDGLHGCTREMAIGYILESPILLPEQLSGSLGITRSSVIEFLLTKQQGSFTKIERQKRIAHSGIRGRLTKELLGFCKTPRDFGSRQLDAIAHYIDLSESLLPAPLSFAPIEVALTVTAENKHPTGVTVDQLSFSPQPIDIELSPQTLVDLTCSVATKAPFTLFDPRDRENTQGKSIEIKGSNGLIGIYAETDMESYKGNDTFVLKVKINQTYQGREFANPQKAFEIPLILPSQNRVDLIVETGVKSAPQRVSPDSKLALRPWPNRGIPVSFSVSNNFHKPRKLQVSLHPCVGLPKDELIFPGTINDRVKQLTRVRLNSGNLPTIASSAPFEIDASVDGIPSEAVKVALAPGPPKPADGTPPPESSPVGTFAQGMVCKIVDLSDEQSSASLYWLPVFPDTRESVELSPKITGNRVLMDVERSPTATRDPIQLSWRLSNGDTKGQGSMNLLGKRKTDVTVVSELDAIADKKGTFLYVSVDGWPRRIPLVWDGLNFTRPQNEDQFDFPNASFGKLSLEIPAPEVSPFARRAPKQSEREFVEIYGLNQKTPVSQIFGQLEINCSIVNQFRFPNSKDFFEINFGNNSERYSFPWKVDSQFGLNEETGTWELKSNVTDYVEPHNLSMNPFIIDPAQFVFADGAMQLDEPDQVKIIFDSKPPVRPEITIHTTEVEPGKKVWFELSPLPLTDNAGGFGLLPGRDKLSLMLDGKKTEIIAVENRRFAIKAPGPDKLGMHRLGVIVTDRLKNSTKLKEELFRVRAKPIAKLPKKKKSDEPAPPPEPPKHVLILRVQIASQALKQGEEPELKIEPPDGSPKRIGPDTFEIKGLKGGVPYKISGEFQTSGAFRVLTKGKTSHEFDKKATKTIKKTKVLTLTGQ